MIMSCDSGTFIAIASSISVFIISAVVFTILGFTCGYCSSQQCNKHTSSRVRTPHSAPDFRITDLELKRECCIFFSASDITCSLSIVNCVVKIEGGIGCQINI